MTSKVALFLGLMVSALALQPQCGWAQNDSADALKKAVDAPTRRPEDRARDQYRHPVCGELLILAERENEVQTCQRWRDG